MASVTINSASNVVRITAVSGAVPVGARVPTGGTTGQTLTKTSGTNYDTEWSTPSGSGDMVAATYDPTTVAGDAFDMANMVEATTEKIFTATERSKLAGIEAAATADQTGAQIKAAYEAEANAFTDAQFTKLAGIETSATADQTGAQIKAAYEAEANAYTDTLNTKLAGIEASADVTDETNVVAALNGATLTAVTVAGTDKVIVQDASDTDNIKTVTAQAIADLGGGGAPEGTAVLSTGEVGGTKFLREDGDGTSSWQTISGGGDALVANPLSQFAATTSAQLAGVLSDETGSGAAVFATSPTLVTPALGTPASGVATNLTGTASGLTAGNVTTNANLTGHVTSVGNAAVLGSFTSAQLATALSDETGSGAAVFATSPTLVTPVLGTPTSGTLTNAAGLPIVAGTTGTLSVARGGTGSTTAADARTALGVAIGTDVQAQGATLVSLEGLTLAAGDIVYATAADTLTRLAKGTAAHVLTMNTGATAPEWAAAAGGSGWTDIAAGTALSGSASVDVTGLSGYSKIRVFLQQASPSADNTTVQLLVSDDNGSTFETTGYIYGGNSATECTLNNGNAFDTATVFDFFIDIDKLVGTEVAVRSISSINDFRFNTFDNGSEVTALRIQVSTGTFDAGTLHVEAQ